MNDLLRMGFRERVDRLEHDFGGLIERERSALVKERGNVAPVEVLHDHVRRACLQRPDVDDARHVLALKLRQRLCLAQEARHGLWTAARLRQEELDGNAILELKVPGSDYDPHPALAENPL